VRFTTGNSIVLSTFLQIFLCLSALADSNSDAIKLYNDKKYEEAEATFKKGSQTTWHEPNAAYYYALTLNALGKTEDGFNACKRIVKQFPKSKAAVQAKIAIELWASKPPPVKTIVGTDVGILGIKFEITEDHLPHIAAVLSGTPADKDLGVGDTILAVDGVKTQNLTKENIRDMVIGKPNTQITLTLKRSEVTFNKTLTRIRAQDLETTHPDIWKLYRESF
jgi:hypothetical protein